MQTNIELLLTGDELMSGDTIDSNSSMIARELSLIDMAPTRRVTLGDDRAALVTELMAMTRKAGAIIVNGGLGPTIDDLTAQIVAEVAGVRISEHPQAMADLQQWCERRRLPLNDANRKQALLPEGCEIIENPIGSAAGFALEISGCLVMCTPGVPSELRAMIPAITQKLVQRFGKHVDKQVLRLQTFGLGESTAQQLVSDNCPDWPDEVVLSFRAGAPQLEIKLTVMRDEDLPARARCHQRLQDLFGDHILGEGDTQIAEAVINLAREHGQRITSAESCTGGLIAAMITKIPGSSDVFPGAFVTYSNELKASVLDVDENTLLTEGAVSEATVRAMVDGALHKSGADLAVAVSGIAGPGGGSPDKPVGTVWIAWGDTLNVEAIQLRWPVERTLFQTMVAAAALDALRRRLAGIEAPSRYFDQRRVS